MRTGYLKYIKSNKSFVLESLRVQKEKSAYKDEI